MRKEHGVLLEYLLAHFLRLSFGMLETGRKKWKIISKCFLPVSCYSCLPCEMILIWWLYWAHKSILYRIFVETSNCTLLNGRFLPAWHFPPVSSPSCSDLASGFLLSGVLLIHRCCIHPAMTNNGSKLHSCSTPVSPSVLSPSLQSVSLHFSFLCLIQHRGHSASPLPRYRSHQITRCQTPIMADSSNFYKCFFWVSWSGDRRKHYSISSMEGNKKFQLSHLRLDLKIF